MSAFKYFKKTERPRDHGMSSFVHAMGPARCRVGEGLLPEHSIDVKEAQGTKVNARMATVDHDR